jgi:uncharacterized protein
MRFLQLVIARGPQPPRDAARAAAAGKAIRESIASGSTLATGGLGKRETAAARISKRGTEVVVEDPPAGDGWMSAGGYSLTQFATKAEAIANARATLEHLGDADVELIEVSAMHPPADDSGAMAYIEVVTAEPAVVKDAYAAIHGLRFEPVTELGNAFVAVLPNGCRWGVRAPMRDTEKPVVRTYVRVPDLDAATSVAASNGAVIALPPTELPGHGRIAIYILGGIEQGLWQSVR